MTRRYTLKRRAERQEETRRRIVDAAIGLHGSLGPERATMSMVAERAGVTRHTLYAHFPDEWALLQACSGAHLQGDPLPDAAPWRVLPPAERLRTGLAEIYGWYGRNAGVAACVLRDAETHEPTRRIAELRFAPGMRAWAETLDEGRGPEQRAMLALALGFWTWRTLTGDGGLDTAAAVEAMARAVEGA